MDLTLAVDAPVGAIVGTLLVYVEHPKQKIVPIPLSGFMRPAMVVTPNDLQSSAISCSSRSRHPELVGQEPTRPLRFESSAWSTTCKGFPPAAARDLGHGREYRVKLDLDPATLPKGAFRGTLKIHTDSSSCPWSACRSTATLK